MNLYEIKNLKKFYKDKLVLDIPSLSLEQGKFYSIYGPNAAGKTTLLQILAFLDFPGNGEILFKNKRVNFNNGQAIDLRRRATLVMQHPYLFKGTVLQNVYYGLRARALKFKSAERRLEDILKKMDLWQLRNKNIDHLSGGERQKVNLARAVVLETEVLLLDEPGAYLDQASLHLLEKYISRLRRETSSTLIMTTHNLEQAHRLGSEIIYLVDGRIKG